ncbi:WD40-repeat-containing domain protein [Blyttiomyces helicus]|uniref:WD40-repeat-containing domain protein n=1 Tax=Blyttiomyces helicus TaxID=388810 RepID=A0A4P9W588_9FUNG|nr:WD40-repeat-containing domain protein [Blyttiomyces helicus]|eukprot:RKO87112.1 WD40-repeat-containing domain protein [Blyttiomyces helicus]
MFPGEVFGVCDFAWSGAHPLLLFLQPALGDEDVLVDESVQGFFDHREPVFAVALHPTDSNIAVSGGGDDKSYLWRVDTGAKVFDLQAHDDSVACVAFNWDGSLVASGGLDGKVVVSRVATGEHVTTLVGPAEINWIDWHPKGNVLIAGSEDSSVWMWQVPSGDCMQVFSGHIDSVTCGRFLPNGKGIVTGSADGTLILWDPRTAAATLRLSGEDGRFHATGITSLAVHSDSNLVISGGMDGSVRLVHIGNGKVWLGRRVKVALFCF